MYKTMNDWLNILSRFCDGTNYEAIINGRNDGVAIVPKKGQTPQRIAVYPKKTQNPGLALEMDIDEIAHRCIEFKEPARIKSNRPHYNDVPEEIVEKICKLFLETF